MCFESAVFTSEVLFRTLQPLPDRIGFDLEQCGDVGERQLLPCHEPEHLDVRVIEARRRGEDEVVLVTVDDRVVRGGRRAMHDRSQPVFEPSPPCRASPKPPA